jgi:hypothetical protein
MSAIPPKGAMVFGKLTGGARRRTGYGRIVRHDLHPCTEQAQALSKEPDGYLKKAKNNDMVQAPQGIQPRSSWHGRTLPKKDRGVKIFKQI